MTFVSSKRLRNSIKAKKAISTPSRHELSKIIDAQWRPRTFPQVPWTLLDPNVWSHQHLVPCLNHPPPGRVRKTCLLGKLFLLRIWSSLMKTVKTSVNNSKCYSKCKDRWSWQDTVFSGCVWSKIILLLYSMIYHEKWWMNKTDSCTTKAKIQQPNYYCREENYEKRNNKTSQCRFKPFQQVFTTNSKIPSSLLYLKIAANKQSSQCNSYLKLENSPLKVDSFKDQFFWKKLLVGSLNYDQLFRTCTVVNPLFLNATDKKFVLKFGLQYFFFLPSSFWKNIIPIFPPLWKKYTKQNVIFRCQNISFFLSQRLYYSVSENTSNHIIVFPSPQIFFSKSKDNLKIGISLFWTQWFFFNRVTLN